ncbi:hypothetical protein [Rhizobium sp. LjRoot254]|uniref:hypothetical protein n=1 Tax=Rhizobium sp. LjRoot254 TaxID=3342297 RepID=UPI003ECFE0F1
MTTFMWVMVLAAGPIVLGCAIAYGLMTQRRLTPAEEEKRNKAIKKMYHKPR